MHISTEKREKKKKKKIIVKQNLLEWYDVNQRWKQMLRKISNFLLLPRSSPLVHPAIFHINGCVFSDVFLSVDKQYLAFLDSTKKSEKSFKLHLICTCAHSQCCSFADVSVRRQTIFLHSFVTPTFPQRWAYQDLFEELHTVNIVPLLSAPWLTHVYLSVHK